MPKENNQNIELDKKALVRPVSSYKPGGSGKPSKPDNEPTSKPKK